MNKLFSGVKGARRTGERHVATKRNRASHNKINRGATDAPHSSLSTPYPSASKLHCRTPRSPRACLQATPSPEACLQTNVYWIPRCQMYVSLLFFLRYRTLDDSCVYSPVCTLSRRKTAQLFCVITGS